MSRWILRASYLAGTLCLAAGAASASPIGYQPSTFTVRTVAAAKGVQIVSLKTAQELLDGVLASRADITSTYGALNFVDPQRFSEGHFKRNTPFAINTKHNDDNFAIHATASVSIPTAGNWTFGMSSDDGVQLSVGGHVVASRRIHSAKDTISTFSFDTAGVYSIDLTYFEHKERAELELYATQGAYKKFKTRGAAWKLIGDTSNGGLELVSPLAVGSSPSVGSAPSVQTAGATDSSPVVGLLPEVGGTADVPEPSTLSLLAAAASVLLLRRRRRM